MEETTMFWKKQFPALILGLMVIEAFGLIACKSTSTTTTTTPPPTTGPGGGAIVNSDSIITAKIEGIRPQTSGYPWEVDILVQSSVDVGTLPNPTKDSVGKVITVKTDEDMTKFKVNEVVTAKVKYVGDVPKPGITLYLYNVALEIPPGY
jgi:hypothetical protein